MKNFSTLGLTEALVRAVTAAGYTSPTPIQEAGIPALLSKKDIVGIAQTGTGKTAAFVLPILNHILNSNERPKPNTCDALILAPTRELATQIHDNIRLYAKYTDITSTIIMGGVKPHKQITALKRGVNILVATPGRLEDHQSTGVVRLSETHMVVLDEADQMLDMGFIPAIKRIMKSLPRKRQTALFSATMPKQIRSLANDFLDHPVEVSVAPASKPIDRIEQSVMHVSKPEKRKALVDILRKQELERAIVFTRTKHGANKIAQHIEKAGITTGAIHGNKSQGQRERTLAGFKAGDIKVLVATDIAARGIDVDGISHVINFELPNVPEVYVHRIGRTARAGTSGVAVSLCDPEERGLLRDIEKLIGRSFGTAPAAVASIAEPKNAVAEELTATQRRNRRRKAKKHEDYLARQQAQKKSGQNDSGLNSSNDASGRNRTQQRHSRPHNNPNIRQSA